jgi:hypothetical protein
LENRTKAERMVECEERKEMEEMKESRFKRICVFCGSSPGNKTSYKDAAIELGNELVISLSLSLPLSLSPSLPPSLPIYILFSNEY